MYICEGYHRKTYHPVQLICADTNRREVRVHPRSLVLMGQGACQQAPRRTRLKAAISLEKGFFFSACETRHVEFLSYMHVTEQA